MISGPLPFLYEGAGLFRAATPYFTKRCEEAFEVGQKHFLIEHQERSTASHGHYFAALHEAWMNLPEDIAHEFPTFDKFRATGLISTGYYNERRILCANEADAQRMAAFMQPLDPLAIISWHGCAVVARTAKSQSYRAMNKQEFRASKEAVLAWAWALIGVDPATGNANAGQAA